MSFNITGNTSLVPGRCTYQVGYAAFYSCYAQSEVFVGGTAYVEDLTTATWTVASVGWSGWWHAVTRYDTCAYSKCYPSTSGREGPFHVHEKASWFVNASFVVGDRYAFVLFLGGWASAYLSTSVARMPGASSSAQLDLSPTGDGAELLYVWIR
jgi:hypothetical protein